MFERDTMDISIRCKNLVRRCDVGAEERAPVYAFLLCAQRRPGRSSTESPRRSPRLRSSIACLPQDVIQHIARLLHEPRYIAEFVLEPDKPYAFEFGTTLPRLTQLDCKISELAVTCLEFGGSQGAALNRVELAHPILRSRAYVELNMSSVWYGTTVSCRFRSNKPGGLHLRLQDPTGDGEEEYVQLVIDGQSHDIPHLEGSWTWNEEPLVVGILVDLLRGCVTFRLNEAEGMCVRLSESQSKWESTPMIIQCRDFPSYDGMTGTIQTAVSSPPCPPSLLHTAANPKSVSELINSGSLVHADQHPQSWPPASDWET